MSGAAIPLCRLALAARPLRSSSAAAVSRSSRTFCSLRHSSSSPSLPSTSLEPVPPSNKPALRSLAQIRAEKETEALRAAAFSSSRGWQPTKEEGESEERIVYERPPIARGFLIWSFVAAQAVCILISIDMARERSLLLPSTNVPLAPSPPTPPKGDSSVALATADPTSPPATQAKASPSRIPTTSLVIFLMVGCVVPYTLLFTWSPQVVMRVTAFKPSGRLRLLTRQDQLMARLPGDWTGRLVEFGVVRQGRNPTNGQLDRFLSLTLPDSIRSSSSSPPSPVLRALARLAPRPPSTLKLDLSPLSAGETATVGRRNMQVVVDRDLVEQAFLGIDVYDRDVRGPAPAAAEGGPGDVAQK